MVVGGGVAGMEATRAAIQAGHTVTLYEKSDHLGGELLAAGNRPLKGEVTDLNLWYQRELKELNANIVLNKEITHRDIISAHPDVVILTVGASSVMPRSIPGIDHPKSCLLYTSASGDRNAVSLFCSTPQLPGKQLYIVFQNFTLVNRKACRSEFSHDKRGVGVFNLSTFHFSSGWEHDHTVGNAFFDLSHQTLRHFHRLELSLIHI